MKKFEIENDLVVKAIEFAATKHRGQERRGSKLPYIVHPFTAMYLMSQYKISKNLNVLLASMLLHDVLEDTDCTYLELERVFGPMVASIVMELTSDDKVIKEIGKKEYIKQKMLNMSKYAFICKLIDRFSNVIDGPTKKYCLDTIETMDFLLKERDELSKTQEQVIKDIKKACKRFINSKNKS